jgi:deoxyribodipyrimidine photolyase-related protein
MERTRWIFAGQLGDSFDDGGRMLLVESRAALRRAPLHRAKAHLILSAIRHRAAELGDRVEFHQVEHYRDVVEGRPRSCRSDLLCGEAPRAIGRSDSAAEPWLRHE